jgi:hypothetical protein
MRGTDTMSRDDERLNLKAFVDKSNGRLTGEVLHRLMLDKESE